MRPIPLYPLLFQISARQLWLRTCQFTNKATATLADVPEEWLTDWEKKGFSVVWIYGMWQTGEIGRQVALTHPDVLKMYDELLPNWTGADVCGSPYAVQEYVVHRDFGGDAALATLRERMAAHGLSLLLDFVPNHTAQDHPWVRDHPEYYIQGSQQQLEEEPDRYMEVGDHHIIAYGRDPYFPSWTDTFQLDYSSPVFRSAMIEQLRKIASMCDGLRCDMAMLLLNDVIKRTWNRDVSSEEGEFWARATDAVREALPDFRFYAEAYWGTEGYLHRLGFDATYHKSLYDDLEHHHIDNVRWKVGDQRELSHSVVFLENHDEPRAASAFPGSDYRHACSVLTFCLPAVRLLHDGQSDGRRVRHAIQLARRFDEAADTSEVAFWDRLLEAIKSTPIGTGHFESTPSVATWEGNPSHEAIQSLLWHDGQSLEGAALVCVNLANEERDALIPLPFRSVAGRSWQLNDLLSDESYTRDGSELSGAGLYVRQKPWQAQVFRFSRA